MIAIEQIKLQFLRSEAKFKKILSIALGIVIILGICALPAFAAATLSLDKTTYAAGEKITVTATGISEQMIKDEAWVSIYKPKSRLIGTQRIWRIP